MPKTRQQKEETVTKLQDKLSRAKALVFADYKGLNMKQLSDLRKKLREQDAEFTVTKNTLLERALQNFKFQISNSTAPLPPSLLMMTKSPLLKYWLNISRIYRLEK